MPTVRSAVRITGLSDFIAKVEMFAKHGDEVFFRGQREDKPLLPRIARTPRRFPVDFGTAEQEKLRMLDRNAATIGKMHNEWLKRTCRDRSPHLLKRHYAIACGFSRSL